MSTSKDLAAIPHEELLKSVERGLQGAPPADIEKVEKEALRQLQSAMVQAEQYEFQGTFAHGINQLRETAQAALIKAESLLKKIEAIAPELQANVEKQALEFRHFEGLVHELDRGIDELTNRFQNGTKS